MVLPLNNFQIMIELFLRFFLEQKLKQKQKCPNFKPKKSLRCDVFEKFFTISILE